jgi:hypothetical protein
MKHVQRSVFVFVLLPVLAFCAGCADSPTAPSHPGQGALAAQGPGGADAASLDSAGSTPSAADPLLLSTAAPQQASCTVQLVKTSVFDPDKGKEGDWIPYDGGVLEVVPPGELFFKYDLKVNIPAKHYVTFDIVDSLLQPGTKFRFPRTDKWKEKTLNGELAGDKSVQLEFKVPQTLALGEKKNLDVKGNTFEITAGWTCWKGLADEVSSGSLGTFKFKGVEKKKKK